MYECICAKYLFQFCSKDFISCSTQLYYQIILVIELSTAAYNNLVIELSTAAYNNLVIELSTAAYNRICWMKVSISDPFTRTEVFVLYE
jgi:hypothetical protein